MDIDKLIEEFEKSGLGNNELAELSGVNKATVSMLLNRKILAVTSDTVKKLEIALGLPKGTLL